MRTRLSSIALSLVPVALIACGGASMPSSSPSESPAGADYGGAPAAEKMSSADSEPMMAAPMAPMAAPSPGGAAPGAVVAGAPPPPPVARTAGESVAVQQSPGVKAGEWDDNANYREFQKYLASSAHLGFHRADIRDRQFLVVTDSAGKGVPRCPVQVSDSAGKKTTLMTMSSGRAILFPHAEGLAMQGLTAKVSCEGTTASASIPGDKPDGVVEIKLNKARKLPGKPTIDLAFILDTTGSMSEEIEATKMTVQKVAAGLGGGNVQFRIGMVTFKDRTDGKVTEVFPMTSDIPRFGRDVQNIGAAGGGDVPESVNEGVHVAMTKLAWGQDAVAKLAFLIGDAPPHLDYQQDADYAADMRDAAHRGIKLFTIAASGMDDLGQVVWRQMAQYTGATNMFVLRGGAGAQSTGGGDPKASCGGTQTNFTSGSLDILISRKVEGEMKALDRNPLKIAGLGLDENAKPCKDRMAVAGD